MRLATTVLSLVIKGTHYFFRVVDLGHFISLDRLAALINIIIYVDQLAKDYLCDRTELQPTKETKPQQVVVLVPYKNRLCIYISLME